MFVNLALREAQHAVTEAPATRYFKVTLKRSAIGLPPKTRNAVKLLGFTKLHQTVYKEHNAVNLGHIFRVKELVAVENVDKIEKKSNKPSKGFSILHSRLSATSTNL